MQEGGSDEDWQAQVEELVALSSILGEGCVRCGGRGNACGVAAGQRHNAHMRAAPQQLRRGLPA